LVVLFSLTEGNGPNFVQQTLKANPTLFVRYHSTATLILLMIEGGYQCPHRTIDEYVKAYTDFRPTDAEKWTKSEPRLPVNFKLKPKVSTLTFEKLSESSRFL